MASNAAQMNKIKVSFLHWWHEGPFEAGHENQKDGFLFIEPHARTHKPSSDEKTTFLADSQDSRNERKKESRPTKVVELQGRAHNSHTVAVFFLKFASFLLRETGN